MIKGNYHIEEKSFENPVPTIMKNSQSQRLVVFTYSDVANPIPTVYFYDLVKRLNIAKATGASIFLNAIKTKEDENLQKLCFYCNLMFVQYRREQDSCTEEQANKFFDELPKHIQNFQ